MSSSRSRSRIRGSMQLNSDVSQDMKPYTRPLENTMSSRPRSRLRGSMELNLDEYIEYSESSRRSSGIRSQGGNSRTSRISAKLGAIDGLSDVPLSTLRSHLEEELFQVKLKRVRAKSPREKKSLLNHRNKLEKQLSDVKEKMSCERRSYRYFSHLREQYTPDEDLRSSVMDNYSARTLGSLSTSSSRSGRRSTRSSLSSRKRTSFLIEDDDDDKTIITSPSLDATRGMLRSSDYRRNSRRSVVSADGSGGSHSKPHGLSPQEIYNFSTMGIRVGRNRTSDQISLYNASRFLLSSTGGSGRRLSQK